MNISQQIPAFGQNYNPGYIGFTVRRKDFIAAGIRWFERWERLKGCPCPSHAFVIVDSDKTIEAFDDGVRYGSLAGYLSDPNVALIVRQPAHWSPDVGAAIVRSAERYRGQKYSYASIAAFALSNSIVGHYLAKLTGGWTARTLEKFLDSRRLAFCSEVAAGAMQTVPYLAQLGILKTDAWTITPMGLFADQECFELGAIELIRGEIDRDS